MSLEEHLLAQTVDNLTLLQTIGLISREDYEDITARLPRTVARDDGHDSQHTQTLAKAALNSPHGQRALSSAISSRVSNPLAASALTKAARNDHVQTAALNAATRGSGMTAPSAATAVPPPPPRSSTSGAGSTMTPSAKDYTPPSGLVSGKGFGRQVNPSGGGAFGGLGKSLVATGGNKTDDAAHDRMSSKGPPRRLASPGMAGIGAGGLPPPLRREPAREATLAPEAAPAPAPAPGPTSASPPALGYCEAEYDYTSPEPGDLSFTQGQVIEVLEHVNEDWWKGALGDRVGIFPRNYTKVI